jgi:hypothetical protein
VIDFRHGPANGVTLALRRAPSWLRVVREPDGAWDALDQIDDTPNPVEEIHVYRIVDRRGPVHVCIRGKGRGASGWYQSATYAHVADIDGEQVRDTLAWRQWCADRAGVPLEVVLESLERERGW